LDADVEGAQGGRIAHRAVDDQTSPAVTAGQLGDHVADQGGVQGTVTVDHQHPTVARLRQHRLEQRVVLETAHSADRTGELGAAAVLLELQIATTDIGTYLIDQIGGGSRFYDHRSMLSMMMSCTNRANPGSASS